MEEPLRHERMQRWRTVVDRLPQLPRCVSEEGEDQDTDRPVSQHHKELNNDLLPDECGDCASFFQGESDASAGEHVTIVNAHEHQYAKAHTRAQAHAHASVRDRSHAHQHHKT